MSFSYRLTRPRLSLYLLLAAPALALGIATSFVAPQQRANASPSAAAIHADTQFFRITFTNDNGQQVPLAVDVADELDEQERGLMGVASLPIDEGELFVFNNVAAGREILVSFWMEGTQIPLSIAFIGKDDVVQEIQDMQPDSTTVHTPRHPYLSAVEANLGWFPEHQIKVGARVDLAGALAAPEPSNGPGLSPDWAEPPGD